jgi:outer membrane receptor for ferrienterochelin and colicins
MMFAWLRPVYVAVALAGQLVCAPLVAQEPSQDTPQDLTETEDRIVYDAAYFAPFSPITLQDMLDRIPGVNVVFEPVEERRGLRSNQDLILINGKQITAKDNDSSAALRRIAAAQVVRIELIRGNVAELEATSNRVLNVILTDEAQSTFSYFVGGVGYRDGTWRPAGNINYAFDSPDYNYTVSLNTDLSRRPWQRFETTTDVTGTPTRTVQDTAQRLNQFYRLSGSLDYRFENGRALQINALAQHRDINREERQLTTDPQAGGAVQSDLLELDRRDRNTAELSVDYEIPLGAANKFTAVAFFNIEQEDKARDVFDIFDPDEPKFAFETRDDLKTETVLRGTYDWTLNAKHSLEGGVEAAYNTQDTEFDLFRRIGGDFVEIHIFNSDSRVEEIRGEPFLNHRWRPSPKWEVETGLTAEISELKQSGPDVNTSRSLQYVKPSVNAFYTLGPRDKLWVSAVRDVTQLNFLEFIATIQEEERELEAGNPDLLPEKSWDLEAGIEHRLSDGGGLLSLSGFYRDISDVSETISFDGLISQPGNIGSGKEYGVEGEVSLNFSAFGWFNGVVTSSYLRRHSEVTDPFSGNKRRLAARPNYELRISYKQDFSFMPASLSWFFIKRGRQFDFDLDETASFVEQPTADVTFEYRFTDKASLSVIAGNVFNRRTTTDRTGFLVGAIDGRIGRYERETQTWGRYWVVALKGSF